MLGLLLALGISASPPTEAGPKDADLSLTHGLAPATHGPAARRRQARVTMETNAAPASIGTNATALKGRSSSWKVSCEGWNGLHLELTRKTLLREVQPGTIHVGPGRLPGGLKLPIPPTNRYRLHLEEARMSAKIGGKLALDTAAFSTGTDFDGFDDGFELRRARLYAKGDCLLLLPVSYQIEAGYIPHEFYIEESYLVFDFRTLGTLKGGQYQAPMGLDVINSSRDIALMEPAAPLQALAPGVNVGLQLGRPFLAERATWAVGLFADGVGHDFGDATKDYGRAITRFTGLPIFRVHPDRPGSNEFLHLGLSANLLYSDGSVQYRSRPESHLAPYVVDTGEMDADGSLVAGAEVAWVRGPLSVQSEFLHCWVHESTGDVPGFHGYYASAGWFLTGESHPYDRTEGALARVIPHRNFRWGHGGWGAWEVVGRYSHVNLNSGGIQGGRLSMLMAGLNWYLHSHMKCRLDYGFGHVSGREPDGNMHILQTRFEVDF